MKYTLKLDEQEMMDVLTGLESLADHAKNEQAEQRFRKLWEKVTGVFEEEAEHDR
jgi:hypothetical protein